MGRVVPLEEFRGIQPDTGECERDGGYARLLIEASGILHSDVQLGPDEISRLGVAVLEIYDDYSRHLTDQQLVASTRLVLPLMDPDRSSERQKTTIDESHEVAVRELGRVIAGLVELRDKRGLLSSLRIAVAAKLEQMQADEVAAHDPRRRLQIVPSSTTLSTTPELSEVPCDDTVVSNGEMTDSVTPSGFTRLAEMLVRSRLHMAELETSLLDPAQVLLAITKGVQLLTSDEEVYLGRIIQSDPALLDGSLGADIAKEISDLDEATKDRMAAEEVLVRSNQRLIRKIASIFAKNTNSRVEIADLQQAGNEGLLIAARRFKPEFGVKFSSYAYVNIWKSMQVHCAEMEYPLSLRVGAWRRLNTLRRAYSHFINATGRRPTISEWANTYNERPSAADSEGAHRITPRQLKATLGMVSPLVAYDSGDLNVSKGLFGHESPRTTEDAVLEQLFSSNLLAIFAVALKKMNSNQRRALLMHFPEPYWPKMARGEIASELGGITGERVRQIENRAKQILRETLADENLRYALHDVAMERSDDLAINYLLMILRVELGLPAELTHELHDHASVQSVCDEPDPVVEAADVIGAPSEVAQIVITDDLIAELATSSRGVSTRDELDWLDDALCAQEDNDLFFPEKGGSPKEAKTVCRRCEVRAKCLEYALSREERYGVWGGLSERERRRLLRST